MAATVAGVDHGEQVGTGGGWWRGGPAGRQEGVYLGEQPEVDKVGQVEFSFFAGGDGGHCHHCVVVEGVERLVRQAGLASQHVEPAPDWVEHPPQAGAVLGMAVQVGLQGAVPVGPAPQRPLGVTVPAALILVAAGGLDLGDLLVQLGQGAAPGHVDQCSAALAGSAATPSDTAAACSIDSSPARAAAATSGWSASRRPVRGPAWPPPGSSWPGRRAVQMPSDTRRAASCCTRPSGPRPAL